MTSRITPLRVVAGLVVLGVVGLGVAVGAPAVFGGDSGNPSATLPVAITPALVQRGAYVAVEGDCAACHTDPGGQSFAGGLGINTPIGAVFTSNITPDKQTGIGAYTYGDFERAVRRGIRPDGSAMYPAMPYPSYAHISDADMEALYAYFMQGVQPVAQPDKAARHPLAALDALAVDLVALVLCPGRSAGQRAGAVPRTRNSPAAPIWWKGWSIAAPAIPIAASACRNWR